MTNKLLNALSSNDEFANKDLNELLTLLLSGEPNKMVQLAASIIFGQSQDE
jgi:hypothetical protein